MSRKNIDKALAEAEKRLKSQLPQIEKRHKKGEENGMEEPDDLKSGSSDDLEIARAVKEQGNEKLPK